MTNQPDTIDYTTLPIFDGTQPEVLTLITPDMERFYYDSDVIFNQGGDADQLIVLLHGQIRIVADGELMTMRVPYSVVGEQAFINDTPRTASAIAQGYVRALVLPRAIVVRLMNDTAFVRNLLHIVSEKLIEATNERAIRFRNERVLFAEFGAHVSPEVAHRLLALGGSYGKPRYIDAVILFADIRSFTDHSAGMQPDEIAEQLSAYFDCIVGIIHQHEGLVDKFIGDAVLAIWGYAPSESDITMQAIACAEEMVCASAQMSFGDAPISIGVGLNAGQVFIGNIGGEGKRQFTALGSPVNLAARFEAANKTLNSSIVVGEPLYERLTADAKARLTAHHIQPIKGAESQTLYTLDPARPD